MWRGRRDRRRINPYKSTVSVRRKISGKSTEIGSVDMLDQLLTVRIYNRVSRISPSSLEVPVRGPLDRQAASLHFGTPGHSWPHFGRVRNPLIPRRTGIALFAAKCAQECRAELIAALNLHGMTNGVSHFFGIWSGNGSVQFRAPDERLARRPRRCCPSSLPRHLKSDSACARERSGARGHRLGPCSLQLTCFA